MHDDSSPDPIHEMASQIAKEAVRRWNAAVGLCDSSPADSGWSNSAAGGRQKFSFAVLWSAAPSRHEASVLTAGLPWIGPACSIRWVGPRLFWWSRGIPDLRRISVVSTRLARRLDRQKHWFDLLRTAMMRIDPVREVVCVVPGTAISEIVGRATVLLGKPAIRFRTDQSESEMDEARMIEWISQRLSRIYSTRITDDRAGGSHPRTDELDLAEPTAAPSEPDDLNWPVEVSPGYAPQLLASGTDVQTRQNAMPGEHLTSALPATCAAVEPRISHDLDAARWVDRLLFAAASRVCVLSVRRRGNVEVLIQRHLADGDRADSLVFLADPQPGTGAQADRTIHASIVRWIVQVSGTARIDADVEKGQEGPELADRPQSDWSIGFHRDGASDPLARPTEWLLHWTRSRPGPWPNQTRDAWLDDVILGCSAANRSAFASLLRIVGEQRLRASATGIRGGFSVISFTEVPLSEFRRRRVYRGHRHRYDFEPWGIAVRREVLQELGAKPVIYGTSTDWAGLPEEQRPFFQKISSAGSATDNLAEREWRLCCDLPLQELGAGDICLFVDSPLAAEILSRQVRCGVVVVPRDAT